jgi:hypothetical protein
VELSARSWPEQRDEIVLLAARLCMVAMFAAAFDRRTTRHHIDPGRRAYCRNGGPKTRCH